MTVSYQHAHPFKDGWQPSRLDAGYDGTFTKHIYAPLSGTINFAGLFNGWDGSHGILLHTQEPVESWIPTHTLYFAEGLLPIVHTGQHVKAGDAIAVPTRSPYNGVLGNIEWGVASPGPVGLQTNTYARELGYGPGATQMVLTFAHSTHVILGVARPTSTDGAGRP